MPSQDFYDLNVRVRQDLVERLASASKQSKEDTLNRLAQDLEIYAEDQLELELRCAIARAKRIEERKAAMKEGQNG